MKALLYKDFKLCTPLQVPLFMLFSAMVLIPNYPYLVAGFFICNAVFYSFARSYSDNDIGFSLLLQVTKRDIVRSKTVYTVIIQLISLILFALMTVVSHFIRADAVNSAGTNASLTLLGGYLLLFSVFNITFIPGYYKRPHDFGKVFLLSTVFVFIFIFIFEGVMVASGFVSEYSYAFAWIHDNLDVFPSSPRRLLCQLVFFCVCAGLYVLANIFCVRRAAANFEKVEI